MQPETLTYTRDNEVPAVDDALKGSNSWSPSPEESEALLRIQRRYEDDMLPYQQEYWSEWDNAKKIIEVVLPLDPYKESFAIPISHMLIDAALAEEIDAFPDIGIGIQEPDDRQKLPFLEAAKKYALINANWDEVKMKALRIRRIYGFCPVRISYIRETRKIKQRVPVKKDNGITLGYETVIDYPKDDIYFEVIDNPRRFLIDPSAKDINEAEDCVLTTEVNWNVYKQKVQHDNRFKNVKFVKPGMDYRFDSKGEFITPDETSLTQDNTKVRIVEYWNKYLDEYVMMANGVIIRQTCLVDDHKELPFAVMHMYRRPHTFYSKGVPKLIESIEAPYNAIMRAEVKATKLAFPILATSDDAVLDPRQVMPYPGIVLEGAMEKATLMQMGSVPNEVYRLKDKFEEHLIWLTGINFKQLYGQNSDRVGIESLKREGMLARVNANLRENEANFLVRLGNILIKDIMQYFPVPRVRALMQDEDTTKLDQDALVKDEKGEKYVGVMEMRKIPVEGSKITENNESGMFTVKATADKGGSYIIARPEYIRVASRMDVYAVRPSAMGSSKEAKKLLFMELSDHAIAVNQAAMQQNAEPSSGADSMGNPLPGKPGKPIWDLTYIEEKLAEANDLPVEKALVSKQGNDEDDAESEMMEIGNMFNDFFKQPAQFPEGQAGPADGGLGLDPTQQNQFYSQVT